MVVVAAAAAAREGNVAEPSLLFADLQLSMNDLRNDFASVLD